MRWGDKLAYFAFGSKLSRLPRLLGTQSEYGQGVAR
jgi:hypothetical protein